MSISDSSIFYGGSYVPAELQHHKTSNGWIVVFYVRNPVTGKYDCRRIKLNRLRAKYRTQVEFKAAALRICDDINVKLAGGWSPYGENLNARMYSVLVDALQTYLDSKKAELTSETNRSYNSIVAIMIKWLNENLPRCTCGSFNKQLAVRFMEYRWSCGISSRTYNNGLKCYRAVWNWLIEHSYCKENPFTIMRVKTTIKKQRTYIPVEQLMRIFRYLHDNNPKFYLVTLLIYYSGLRPIEVKRLKVGDIDLKNGCLRLRPEITKNHRSDISNLSSELVELLLQHISNAKPSDYLFSPITLETGSKMVGYESFRKRWDIVKRDLDLPDEYQLYSLRDSSGVHRFQNGASSLDVMHSLRHSDLKMTSIYTDHFDSGLHDRLEKVTPHL